LIAILRGRPSVVKTKPGKCTVCWPPARLACSGLARALAVLCIFSLLVGCTQTKPQTAMSAHVNYPSSVRILLIEPDIEVSELTAGGGTVPNAAWTQQAKNKVQAALKLLMVGRNAEIVPYSPPDVVDPYDPELQLLKLHSVLGPSILLAPQIPTRKNRFDWGLGPDAQLLVDAYDADYALFVYFRDSFATAGRKVLQFVVAFAGYHGISGGSQFGFASLVDLQKGQVVWFNQLRSDSGDLRELDSAMAATKDLLIDFPIAQGGSVTTQVTEKTNSMALGQRTKNLEQSSDKPSSETASIVTPEAERPLDGMWIASDGLWTAELIVFDRQFQLKVECDRIVEEASGEFDDKGRMYKILGQGKYWNVVVSGSIDQLHFVSNSGLCGKTTLKFR